MNNEDKPTPKTPPANKKVFDVMRPGKTPASANSRPMIVGHKPQVQDDMFVPGENTRLATDPSKKHGLMDSSKKVDIKPVGVETDDEPRTAATSDSAPLLDSLAKEEPTTDDEPQTEAPVKDTTVEILDESGGTAPLLEEHTTSKPEDDILDAPVEVKEEAPVEKMQGPAHMAVDQSVKAEEPAPEAPEAPVEDTKQQGKVMTSDELMAATNAPLLDHAVVSHHKHHTKWWEWMLIFLLVVIIALVALDLLLDAKVISTDLDVPYTNFIK